MDDRRASKKQRMEANSLETILAGAGTDARAELQNDFAARFEGVRRRLTAVCAAVVGAEEAVDLVQETYLRASARLHQLRDPRLFDAWVVRIALNEAKAVVRKRRLFQDRIHRRAAVGIAPERDLGVRDLVEQLPARERAVIVLHYAYGFRMAEIARLLQLSDINVRVLAFRARRRLRSQLQEATR